MSTLFVDDNDVNLKIKENRLVIYRKEECIKSIPIRQIDSLMLMSNASVTTACIKQLLKLGIPIVYTSQYGKLYGKVDSSTMRNTYRQRRQCSLYDTDFSLDLAKKMLNAKLHNQSVVLRRYSRSKCIDNSEYINAVRYCMKKIDMSSSINEIIGYEGRAAKCYFKGLSKCVGDDFKFNCRSRPARDEINAMLNFGYTMLYNMMLGLIESHNLNPCFGFIHRDANNHMTLASDLMEEWRPIVVDTVILGMISRHEITKKDFEIRNDEKSVVMNKNVIEKFSKKILDRYKTSFKYVEVSNDDTENFVRTAMNRQIYTLIKAIEKGDASYYEAVRIR